MRTFKSESSGMPGSELLSVLMGPNGSQTKLDDCVAQVVTIGAGGGEVTALVLAHKTAFEVEVETVGELTPLTMETTMVEGENYDWFEQWDRLMVWRPKDGPSSDKRAEAALLAALRGRLARSGPRNKPEAVDALCRQVFGEHDLHDLHAILKGSGEMQEQEDGVTVAVTRPVDPSELAELLARVPKGWMPVLQRSAEWKTADWIDGGDVEATQRKPRREMQRCLYTTAGVLTAGLTVGLFANLLLPSFERGPTGTAGEEVMLPETFAKLSDDRTGFVWARGDYPVPVAQCGSGTLLCGNECNQTGSRPWSISFGYPWPLSFPLAWNIAHEFAHGKCEINCRTPAEIIASTNTRLLTHFPLQNPLNTTMSSEDQVEEIFGALRTRYCAVPNTSWQIVGSRSNCVCDAAVAGCRVVKQGVEEVLNNDREYREVVFADFEAPLARVANSFADYPDDVYDVTNCGYTCWNLTPEARETVRANKAAIAAYQATSTSATPSTSTGATPKKHTTKKVTRKDIKFIRLSIG
ncbi:putative transmembrane protein [Gregarina niphandrodes]|uniref:Transmembrane protein n=1 Tax=Gregarina niphandrodes TaxID=110365 RepID=A0A023AZQ1_GRENI|nr:putative transmembrane protein [Gregarina niphandrodes]EZG43993.1 putative transmembrane protein [Gregarina niphandrodes]|eukprot:XP_011132858.1 putative transmembrane protein [Gregarina niphandrodes]